MSIFGGYSAKRFSLEWIRCISTPKIRFVTEKFHHENGYRRFPNNLVEITGACTIFGRSNRLFCNAERFKLDTKSEQIKKQTMPSVVRIEGKGMASSIGSGFILENGWIMTCGHVVQGKTAVNVITSSLDKLEVGSDDIEMDPTKNDLAILKVSKDKYQNPIPDGLILNPAKPSQGDRVLAFGNSPAERFSVISGKVIDVVQIKERNYDYIKTDALIQPGYSGGPLVNMGGDVIGIIEGVPRAQNEKGLAISSEYAAKVVQRLKNRDK